MPPRAQEGAPLLAGAEDIVLVPSLLPTLPALGAEVDDLTPTFIWQAVSGADRDDLYLAVVACSFDDLLASPTENTFTLPEGSAPDTLLAATETPAVFTVAAR